MKMLNKAIALLLAMILVSGSFVCFAAEGEKKYYDYDKVLLLGDSEASGFTDYGDEMSEFTRVDNSYAAFVADYFKAELIPMACPGFRTLELRCMLDDNYRPDDDYLFKKVPRTSEEEIMKKAPAMKQAIKDSDMIIIGIGGNDWGAYLGWVMADKQLEHGLPEEYRAALRTFLKNATVEDDIIGQIIDLADYFNAFTEVNAALPEAAFYAFSTLRKNWEYIVEYIYENNPDVTLVTVGMFPTYFKTEKGAPDVVAEPDAVAKVFEDAMITYGNKHMIEYQDVYGYIYVDTYGTVVETCHPTVAGHKFIKDRILEELPDARFQYSADVAIRNVNYKAIEYVTLNGIMAGSADGKFSPDAAVTKDVFTASLSKLAPNYSASDSTKKLSKFEAAWEIFNAGDKTSIESFIKTLKFAFEIISANNNVMSRAAAAEVLYTFAQTK